MPEYKVTIEVMFTADDEDEADVHVLECAEYLENAGLVLSTTAVLNSLRLGAQLQ